MIVRSGREKTSRFINLFTNIRILLVLSLLIRVSEAEGEGVDMTGLLLVHRPSFDGLQIDLEIEKTFYDEGVEY